MLAHTPAHSAPGVNDVRHIVTKSSGISQRAVAQVLTAMVAAAAVDAPRDGTVRISGSELAVRTRYSGSVIMRAQRHLVDLGAIERVDRGGGRTETLWRIDPEMAETIVRPDEVRFALPQARQRAKVLRQQVKEES